jgi:hypothetical protein
MTLNAFLALRRGKLTSSDKSAWRSFANRNYHIQWFSEGEEDELGLFVGGVEMPFRVCEEVKFNSIPLCIRHGFEPTDIPRAWKILRMGSARHCMYRLQDVDGDVHCAL